MRVRFKTWVYDEHEYLKPDITMSIVTDFVSVLRDGDYVALVIDGMQLPVDGNFYILGEINE